MNLKFVSSIAVVLLLSATACKKTDVKSSNSPSSFSFEKIVDQLIIEATKQVTVITGDGKIAGGYFASESDLKKAISEARTALDRASGYNKLSDKQKATLKNISEKIDTYEKNYLSKV